MWNLRKLVRKLLGRSESEWALRIERDNNRVKKILSEILQVDSNCIDIGSHRGMYLEYFLKVAPQGSHIAIEPLPQYYAFLKQHFPSVSIYNVALSDFEGTATFFNAKGAEAMSGLRKQHYPNSVVINEIIVEVKQLDKLMKSSKPISFIKIDVEGAELNVLKGATQLVTRDHPIIQFEFAQLHAQEFNVTPEQIFDFFIRLGYEIFRLDRGYKYSHEEFKTICMDSHKGGYNKNAETNFIAIHRS